MRIDIPKERKLVHEMIAPIRWGDMDAYGHLNNTVYFRFMEQVRIEWLAPFGHLTRSAEDSPVVVTASCHFIRPITYPATVQVALFAEPPGRSSFHTFYEIRTEGTAEPCATGEARVVWVSAASGKSTPLPDWLRAALPRTPQGDSA